MPKPPATILAVLLALPPPLPAATGELRVEVLECGRGVHLVANAVPVSQVLERLSRELGFTLVFRADADPPINLDTTQPPAQLVKDLLASGSVVYNEGADPRCPDHQRLTKVWVLPKGGEGPPEERPPTPMEIYRKAHGLPPETAEEKAARGATPETAR